jgi:hypothetical protein
VVVQPFRKLPTLAILFFLRELRRLYNIAFLPFLHQWKTHFDFYVVFAEIQYMVVIWIPVRLNPDLLKQIRILERTWQFMLCTFSLAVRVVAKSPGSENHEFVHLWMRYFMDRSFTVKRPRFKRKNVFANLV